MEKEKDDKGFFSGEKFIGAKLCSDENSKDKNAAKEQSII